jgi:hypothetical protein
MRTIHGFQGEAIVALHRRSIVVTPGIFRHLRMGLAQ